MAVQYKTGICLLFLLISSPVPSACVTILACTSPATTISLTQVSETFKYPSTGSYPLLTTCEWLFQSSDTSNTISFVVSNIYVDCGDILRFHDGTSSSASAIGNAICCSGCTHAYKSTTGNNLYGKLSTDNTLSASESGFQVTINVGKDESSCPTSPTVNPSVSLSSSITLTSPRFPKAYPSNFECTYTYTYSSGTIQIEFLYLDVEPNGSDCYDFVEIYDGSSTSSSVIKRVCGTTLPAKYTSTGSSMTLKFSSDAYSTNLGYKAIISPVGTEESTTTASTVSSTVEDSTTTATTEGSTSDLATTVVSTDTETTTASAYTSSSATQGSTSVSTSSNTIKATTQGSTSVSTPSNTIKATTQGSTLVSTSSNTIKATTQGSTFVSTPSNTIKATTQGSTPADSITTVVSVTTKGRTSGGHFNPPNRVIDTMSSSVNVGYVTAGVIIGIAAIAVIVLIILLLLRHSKKGRVDFENQTRTQEMKMNKYKR